jgi:hypothetical protein
MQEAYVTGAMGGRIASDAQRRLREVDTVEVRIKWRHHEAALDALLVRGRRLAERIVALQAQVRDLAGHRRRRSLHLR